MNAGDLIGMPVIDLSLGEQVDSVRDVLLDRHAGRVLGIEIVQGGWPRRKVRVIPFSAVYSVGEDAVMVLDSHAPPQPDEQAGLDEARSEGVGVIGLPLLSPRMGELGQIQDVTFDIYTGEVAGYVLSGGERSFARVKGGLQVDKRQARVPEQAGIEVIAPALAPAESELPIPAMRPSQARQANQVSKLEVIAPPLTAPPATSGPVSARPVTAKPVRPASAAPQPTFPTPAEAPFATADIPPADKPVIVRPTRRQVVQGDTGRQVHSRLKTLIESDRRQLRGETVRPTELEETDMAHGDSAQLSSGQFSSGHIGSDSTDLTESDGSVPTSELRPTQASQQRTQAILPSRAVHPSQRSMSQVSVSVPPTETDDDDSEDSDAMKWLAGSLAALADRIEAAERELLPDALTQLPSESESGMNNLMRQVVGWPVARDIVTEDGEVILYAGEEVTTPALARAQDTGMLRELLTSVEREE